MPWPGADKDFGPMGHLSQETDTTEPARPFFHGHDHNRTTLPTALGRSDN